MLIRAAVRSDAHNTFIFGREDDCHAKLSAEDTTASRHHFLLEVNPPDARLQDIGSRNGTYINSQKFGGRPAHMTPEEARKLDHPTVDLKDGDEIEVGKTVFKIRVEVPAICCECGDAIPDKYKKVCVARRSLRLP
jgi:pSer/pThr/pTyr-binding forkhead associated (FHA) protein